MAIKLVFKNLSELEPVHKRQAVEIFAASFFEPLSFISSNLDIIADVLEHSLVADHHYVALLHGNVVSIVSISNANGRSHKFQRDPLVSQLGFFRGTIAFFRLRGVLERPLELQESQCFIELVATDSAFRGLGISTALQRYLFTNLPYRQYFLEVAEMNFNAIRIYEKLGFIVEERTPQRSFWKPKTKGGKVTLRKMLEVSKIVR
ncbi:MAG: GNAT family N-acetyltransferase [Sphaerochaetaceae bacterium]|nr:GNAT family N-acetyltransferase [Sphaerochaetaceae bacterium]